MQTIIEVKNLTHVYTDSENKEIKALDRINLEIRQGEFVAVIGANGSGKSTLARHFNALQRPSEGGNTAPSVSSAFPRPGPMPTA